MRAAQFRLLTSILEKTEIPEYVYAFEKGKSIPKMAERHVGKGVVISIDLKDFFTSIKQHHVQRVFETMGFAAAPARTLSELCTYKSFVPQGALTSPKLSNIITTLTFGPLINEFCVQRGFSLSIYADDITISTPDDIVKTSETGYGAVKEVIDFVSQSVEQFGFKINRRKTKVMRPFQRQYVCGAVVNSKVNLQKPERNKLRAIVYNCQKNGLEAEAAKNNLPVGSFVSKIMGRLNWFAQLNPEAGSKMKNKFTEITKESKASDLPTEELKATAECPW